MPKKPRNRISELGLVEYFKGNSLNRNPAVIKGIGDDTAVVKISRDKYLLYTADMLIEGRHFTSRANLYDVGHKAMSCSLSDIAAMGGVPSFALISLGIPKRFKSKDVKLLFSGLKKSARKFSVDIVGGDTNTCDKLVVDVSMIGCVKPEKLTLRSGAKDGDYLFVTGSLGGSIYKKHLKFTPRVAEAKYLVNKFSPSSMIDISDGLVLDLWRVCKASGVGAVIFQELVPVSRDAKNFDQALYMGEDFELLFTLPEKKARTLLGQIASGKPEFPVSFIGKVIDEKEKIWLVDKQRRIKRIKPKGFLHF